MMEQFAFVSLSSSLDAVDVDDGETELVLHRAALRCLRLCPAHERTLMI